ncbi:major facilitator superfamily domain-containing protein [Penicillium canescens]|uniref:Major facilitator superfamily domain-containing protein n=1 Tax=Penicillium canescens TaxID=5083 RepID=A0AAD6N2Q0_PENCN|nr:major facilitator superfamily domain-containing protein [Penicillium canescens]KAJ6026489.1 major facilitator superfamily domain-containing protein [Penicillium canescens]KAJ6039772.1 major facilitator superfamily domain-containing protein [Penicillium canescens]KAJ6067875.1 major facilitator superfamily domain-containing protein [Penicillium canescens]
MEKSETVDQVEDVAKLPIENADEVTITKSKANASGTVKLLAGKIVYIPSPTADPRDPLNRSAWQKGMIVIVISIFATVGLSLVSGFGGIMNFYSEQYLAEGKTQEDLTHLTSYPGLTMGIGNLIGMPLAYSIGRRPVLLASTVILVLTSALCATAKTYEWHLAVRLVMGLAAGQAEALVPMITQEIFFLHERGTYLMIQNSCQSIIAAVYILFAGPIAGAIGAGWWYGLGACLSGLTLILAFFFLPETKYARPLSSFQEARGSEGEPETKEDVEIEVVTEKPPLDYERYAPRTWRSDLSLWSGEPEWRKGLDMLKDTFLLLWFPNIFWAMVLNGFVLGVNVAISVVYSTILTSPPYNWPNSSPSYANCGQIITSIVAVPVLGYGSDKLIAWQAKRRGGIHEPEVRLIPLIIPIIIGTFTSVLFGQGGSHPEHYHWFLYVWTIAAYYFAFIAVTIQTITYLLDCYPQRSGPILIIICAFRGIIAFGTTYAITPFVLGSGFDLSFGIYGVLTFGIAAIGIPVYIWGKQIRQFTGRWAQDPDKRSY